MKHDLTGGGWAEIRPATDLKGADRTAINHHVRVTVANAADMDDGSISTRKAAAVNLTVGEVRVKAMIARAVKDWSFPEPVPFINDEGEMENAGSLEEIGLGPLMEIEDLILPHIRMLMRQPDPKETTTSSSNGRSSARATPQTASAQSK